MADHINTDTGFGEGQAFAVRKRWGTRANSTQHTVSIASGVTSKLMAREKGTLPKELWSFQQSCSSTIHSSLMRSLTGAPLSWGESLSIKALDTVPWPGILRQGLVKSQPQQIQALVSCPGKCSSHSSPNLPGLETTPLPHWASSSHRAGGFGGPHASGPWRREWPWVKGPGIDCTLAPAT